ncbi:hypothetical protein RRF57_004906 [Xylaria bambusicola]|uniref:Uncharacterized protein n=1 Tax=Xylaria bambusicola TaxID=326684 RepID=A0AAN7UMK9_9PEZI
MSVPCALAAITKAKDEAEATSAKFHQDADLQAIIKALDTDPTIYLACAASRITFTDLLALYGAHRHAY